MQLKCFIEIKIGFTTENELEAREDSQTSLGGLRASYFRALHSNQGKDGTKETKTYRGDHQTPTHLDVGFTMKTREEGRVIQISLINYHYILFLY